MFQINADTVSKFEVAIACFSCSIPSFNSPKSNTLFCKPSSSSTALQLCYSLGPLNNILPVKAVLYLFCPLHNFTFFRPFLTSPSLRDLGLPAGLPVNGFHLCILFTVLVSGILLLCPNQLNRWALTQCVTSRCLFRPSRYLF